MVVLYQNIFFFFLYTRHVAAYTCIASVSPGVIGLGGHGIPKVGLDVSFDARSTTGEEEEKNTRMCRVT